MTGNLIFKLALIASGFAGSALAGDVQGKWVAEVLTRLGGSQLTTFNFKTEGSKLSGMMSTRAVDREISDGRIKGDEISFAVVEKVRDMEQRTVYRGRLIGDEIQFEAQMKMPPGGLGGFIPGPPTEFTAKRSQ